ncbi:MAG: hypothetical protein JWO45_604 [Spartobacteria bacterium]|nr:hypothetical protein [Spartobacteria bacterium]
MKRKIKLTAGILSAPAHLSAGSVTLQTACVCLCIQVRVTIFLGCGFAAKYREGGGNFSVPLQWMLGLRRLKLDAIWLEYLPATNDPRLDRANIANFQRRLREHGLAGRYCLLYHNPASDVHDLEAMRCIGMSKRQLCQRLTGPNVLLNLSYSIHPPLLLRFERRIFCDLDPSEIFYWMTKLEMGQAYHHEFWTIGLNAGRQDCRLPRTGLKWKTFYPLADTRLLRPQPAPGEIKFTTIGQWYWSGMVEVNGEFPDLSKKVAFEPYLGLPARIPQARFELAMNINPDDPERLRLQKNGWHIADPHSVARTPSRYRQYLTSATAEFTAIKGVDVSWRTGWVSDRAAAFLALGRPVITEDTGAARFLPPRSGLAFVHGLGEAAEAAKAILHDWPRQSKEARESAVEDFDSVKNLRRILDL